VSATTLRRHPIATAIAAAVVFAVLLLVLWLALPLSGNNDHAVGHFVLGVPILLLMVLAVRTWPAPNGRAAVIARNVLLAGLGLWGGGLMIEGIGAYGYDGNDRTSGLAVLHDLGVVIGPFGLVLTMAGAITSVGVDLAARRGAAGSRYFTAAVVLAAVVAVAFVAGGFIFGY
jgi:hypothetical protein